MAFTIQRAERRKAKARIGLTGPSGSGKSYSALLMAKGIAEEMGYTAEHAIGVLDTERGSAQLYADLVPFVVLTLEPPYSPPVYVQALNALEKHGCQVIILDSISHAWAGEGGLLERVDAWKAGAKNAMSAWQQATPEQQRFVDAMLRSSAHIIATMRSKTEWVIETENRNGRSVQVPRKIGMAPVQRDGMEYEFTAFLDIESGSHMAIASKDRTHLFEDRRTIISADTGRELARWLNSGGPERFEEAERQQVAAKVAAQRPAVDRLVSAHMQAEKARAEDPPESGFPASEEPTRYGAPLELAQLVTLHAKIGEKAKRLGVEPEAIKAKILREYRVESSKELGQDVWSSVLTMILKLKTADLGGAQ